MEINIIIDSPFSNGKAILKKEETIITLKKSKYKILENYYMCLNTGEKFTTSELDTININQVHGHSDNIKIKTMDERSEEYAKRTELDPNTYVGDVETAYVFGCIEQQEIEEKKIKELEGNLNEIKSILNK